MAVMSWVRSILRTMSTVISGIRVKFCVTEGDVRVTSGGKLMAGGVIAGTLTVESGGYAYILGMVGGVVPPKSWRVSYAASGLVLDSLIS